ncbi:MAG: hypothetical protein ACJ73D_08830 [Pyrinomonadaceae bacterium]
MKPRYQSPSLCASTRSPTRDDAADFAVAITVFGSKPPVKAVVATCSSPNSMSCSALVASSRSVTCPSWLRSVKGSPLRPLMIASVYVQLPVDSWLAIEDARTAYDTRRFVALTAAAIDPE